MNERTHQIARKLPKEEREDILSDYQEHFIIGMEKGALDTPDEGIISVAGRILTYKKKSKRFPCERNRLRVPTA
ncbi:MAG TPA: DUF1700 domain-containing protein [Methanobacterium sp.]|jgi:hypothetical protein|nr:DUF1700 domain-containing protein [Methanobacterium sp.]